MPMKGFDPRVRDLPDYILSVTKEIWEDRNVAALRRYYAETIPVRTPGGLTVGSENVIAATLAVLAEFPDRTLLGEDVIWSGDEESGFLSSHRLLSTATHSRPGVFGEPTGKRLKFRAIADCAARDNRIFDEWLIRDQGAVVRQMGWDPKGFAADQILREGGPERCQKPFTPDMDVDGGYQGHGNDHAAGQRYAEILSRIMDADLGAIPAEYDRAAQVEWAGGLTGHGHPDADGFWMGLRAAFPNARFEIRHRIGRDDPGLPPRAALRWSLWGKHDGWGSFGAPTGAEVYVMGISHAEFGPWGLRREYVLYDEVAVLKQILLKTG